MELNLSKPEWTISIYFSDGNDVIDHYLEGEGELDERVLDFFELEENQPEQTEPVEPTTTPVPRHPLVPDAIVNYPYGKDESHHASFYPETTRSR